MSPPSLPISETFTSIQGEGMLAGVPSFFVRVSGCNLRCSWCDTPYASWSPEHTPRSVESILDEAASANVSHAVLTGGEPMMFDAIEDLASGLRSRGLHVTIETAGTIDRRVACDLMSISPKLANSTPLAGDERDPTGHWRRLHDSRRINLDALRALLARSPEHQIKFVVRSADGLSRDLREIETLLAAIGGTRPDRVLLMPEGTTTPTREAQLDIVALCIARGWRYCPRLHIELFGNKRGT